MKNIGNRTEAGVSVIELIIVLVVISVLVTIAVGRYGSATHDLQRQNIARELKIYLERARFDSVKRRAATNDQMASVTLNNATSLTAAIDFNEDGTLSSSETRSVDFTRAAGTVISVVDSLNYPVTIRFNQRGHAIVTDSLGNTVTPVFQICNDCTTASPDYSYLSISALGTVADTRTAPGALPTPSITANVSNTTMNCYILVNNHTPCTQ